jgi:hypothetical protein
MALVILGIVLLAVAVILYVVSRTNRRRAAAISITEISPIGQLQTLYQQVAQEVGKGSFVQRVAVQGTLECAQPLQSELSNTSCAAFSQRVERRWEERYEQRDNDGNTTWQTREGSETVSSNDRRAPFQVHDESGWVAVLPDDAKLEMETTVDRFEAGNQGGARRFLNFELDLGGFLDTGQRRTTGYHIHEEVLPLGRTVFVLGAATDRGGSLSIGKPPEKHEPFLVSLRSRDDVIQSAKRAMAYTLYGSGVCAVVGVILIVVGFIMRR